MSQAKTLTPQEVKQVLEFNVIYTLKTITYTTF